MSDDETGTDDDGATDVETSAPVLRVVSPDATAEEVAALVAVFSALGGDSSPPAPRRPEWSSPGRMHRVSGQGVFPHAGPHGWRASGLPR